MKNYQLILVFPSGSVVDTPDANRANAGGGSLIPRLGRSPGGGNGKSIPVFLTGKSYGWRSLAGYIQSMGSQRVGHD